MAHTKKIKNLKALAQFDAAHARRIRGDRVGEPPVLLAGVDEAGRGPLAGPVVAAAVILSEGACYEGLNDSKQLSALKRDAFYDVIMKEAVSVGVGIVGPEVIDEINILNATKQAARLALLQVSLPVDLILLDALKLPDEERPQLPIIKGDATSQSIAAASVVAKVTRDRLMVRYHEEYPEYGFAAHKGYGVAAHLAALREFGPCSIHRMSFAGVCFFSQSWRWSHIGQALREEINLICSGDEASRCDLARRVEELESFLPDREISELRRLSAPRQCRFSYGDGSAGVSPV